MLKENHPHWTRRYGIAILSFALAFGLPLSPSTHEPEYLPSCVFFANRLADN